MLNEVLIYIKFGWYIFPLCPKDKKPLTPRGFKDSSNDPTQINKWLEKWPDANWGLDCEKTHLVIFDLDTKNGTDGVWNWRELCGKLGISHNSTVVALTPTGGQHIYYKAPADFKPSNSTKNLPEGIDVRSKGYVVLPGSIHPNGKPYTWELSSGPDDTAIAPLPEPLIKMLVQKTKPDTKQKNENDGPILKGCREATLLETAGWLRRVGNGEETVRTTLVSMNKRCVPPLYDSDIDRLVKSAMAWPPEITYNNTMPPINNGGAPRSFLWTDLGNAKRLVHTDGKNIRYCAILKNWFIWDGIRWKRDDTEQIRTYAQKTVEALIIQAQKAEGESDKEKLVKTAKGFQSNGHIEAIQKQARSLLPITPDKFDKDGNLFNLQNGTLDLNTCEVREHRHSDFITKLAPVKYDPNAKSPLWLEFLDDIMGENQGLIDFLQRAIGYSLSASNSEQGIFILHGIGENGKSTFIKIAMALLGDYATQASTETLLVKKTQGIPSDIAKLVGTRFISVSETDQGRRLSESLIKQLTGGDKMSVRELFGQWFDFEPKMKFWLSTNHKPDIRGTDHAIWRRINLIPFEVRISDIKKVDKDFPIKLMAELPGILNWAIEGHRQWILKGLDVPNKVLRATEDYRTEMDMLGQFIDECCDVADGLEVPSSDLHKSFQEWANSHISQNQFGRLMKDRHFDKHRSSRSGRPMAYMGITLKSEDNHELY